jgi:hypothetical protein
MAIAVIGAGCSRSVDVDSVESSTAKNPSWVSKAYADARKKLNADAPLEAPATDESTTTTTAAPVDGLPPKDQFVAALSATGLDPTAAGCIYDSIEGTPLAATTGKLLASASDPLQAAVANNNGIDEATQKQLLVALAPCLDTKTLLSVLGSVSGASGTATGGTGATPSTTLPNINAMQTLLASVIKQAGTLSSSVNASSLAKAAGANLTPAQIQALQNAIAAAQNLQTTDTSQIDLSKLDVSKLNQEQLVDLISVLIKGLTPAQLAQLNQVAAVDLQDLNLNIDVSKLSHDELGSLFVVLLPFIAAGISAPGGQAPSGVQPGQIYIPPGTDLSDINPLNFVPQETVVAGLEKQYGLSAGVSTCLYQKVKQIDPRLLGAAYQGTNLTGAAQLLLSVLSCVGA